MPTSRARPVSRRELDTDDPTAIRRYLTTVYGAALRVRVLGGSASTPPRLHHVRAETEGFAVEVVRHDGAVEILADECPNVVVLWVTSGRVECTIRGMTAIAGPGDVVMGSTGSAPVRLVLTGAAVKTAVLDRKLVQRVAADDGFAWRPVRFKELVPADENAARAWTTAHEYVANSVLALNVSTSPMLSAAGRLLAAAILSTFPVVDDLDTAMVASGDQPAVLRRAIAYLQEHAQREISVVDLAHAMYVTPRALQYLFRKHLDTTPMAYLRSVRLDRAHLELLRSDRSSTTVAATAARWGFAHTGRFAVLYRDTYGRSPHVTLRA